MQGGCIPCKNNFKTQKNNKLRWLATDIDFKLLYIGCPIAHDIIVLKFREQYVFERHEFSCNLLVKVKLWFLAPRAGIAEIEQT